MVRRFTRYDRDKALTTLAYMLYTNRANRLGVSSDQVIFIDYDATSDTCRKEYRRFVSSLSRRVTVFEITTERGYHLILATRLLSARYLAGLLGALRHRAERKGRIIVKLEIDEVLKYLFDIMKNRVDTFEGFYLWIEQQYDYYINNRCIDRLHIDISISRGYTTLRISGKEGKPYDMALTGVWNNGRVSRITIDELDTYVANARVIATDVDGLVKDIVDKYVESTGEKPRYMTYDTLKRLILTHTGWST